MTDVARSEKMMLSLGLWLRLIESVVLGWSGALLFRGPVWKMLEGIGVEMHDALPSWLLTPLSPPIIGWRRRLEKMSM
jgi:hypothetical protein